MPTAHPSDGRFCSRVKATLLLFAQSGSNTLAVMIIFGKWPLWLAIGLCTFVTAAALVAGGQIVLAAGLVIVVGIGGYYYLRGGTD